MEPCRFKGDSDEIARSLKLIHGEEGVYEIRALKVVRGKTTAGYYDDQHFEEAIRDATELSGMSQGVYLTLNPVDRRLLARSCYRLTRYADCLTKDHEILRRRWLPVDFDPKRPAGISSTDAEHQAALSRASDCRDHLRKQGFPDPIFADSGNGAHLLYRIDLPNDTEREVVVKRILESLASKFTDSTVDLDRSVYNAARIWKLYGTLSAKGDHTADRPHRIARILEVPNND